MRGAVRFDPRDQGVALRIATVLRARGFEVGPLLPVALGGRVTDSVVEAGCTSVDATGTIRRTIPAADVSAVLLAASVSGAEAGAGVVRGVLGEWTPEFVGAITRRCHGVLVTVGLAGWFIQSGTDGTLIFGFETGPEGRKCADAALLRLGFAYLDSAAPFGVVAPFLNLEPR
jgi:hypothetical protein